MIIAIDVDDVLSNFAECWFNTLNKTYNKDVDYSKIRSWDMNNHYPDLTQAQRALPLESVDFWGSVKPQTGAVKYLDKLIDDGHKVYLCTSTDYRFIKVKYENFIRRYFPRIKWRDVIVAYDKHLINADVLIDDAVHNLINGSYKKILFSAPHNLDYDAENNGMIRANNWEEVYKIISEMEGDEYAN